MSEFYKPKNHESEMDSKEYKPKETQKPKFYEDYSKKESPPKQPRTLEEAEDEKPPLVSEVLNKLYDFYDDYIQAPISKIDTRNNFSKLKKWMEHYQESMRGGKADFKFNFRPIKIKELCTEVHLRHRMNWPIFPDKWQLLLEILGLEQAHPVLIMGVISSIADFKTECKPTPDYEVLIKTLRNLGNKGWWVISIDNIEKYASAFEVNELPTEEGKRLVKSEIDRLIGQQNYKDAATMISAFTMHRNYDLKNLVDNMVKRELVDEATKFLGNDSDLARVAINAMNPRKHSKNARELIKRFSFNPYDFPKVVEAQTFLAVRSLVSRLGWMIAEEKVMTYTRLEKEVLVEVLAKDKLYSEALGVAQRYNLTLPRNLQYEIRNKHGLKAISNKLLLVDEFAPTEVYLENLKAETYLNMQDFGFKLDDVMFINKIDKQFEEVSKKLMAAKTVGVDAEFSSDLIGYATTTIAILQLATPDLAVIIDFIALKNNDILYEFCLKFFGSKEIEKIGHTFTSDIKCLKSTFQDKPMEFENIINIDEGFIEGKQKMGLAAIVKKVYSKEFSKYNQQSNWDRRPLRKSQIHYAALDAVATLNVFLKIQKDQAPQFELMHSETYSTNSHASESSERKKEIIVQHEHLLEEYKKKKEFKFLLDGMLKKLALNIRNIGHDAVYADDALKPAEIVQLAEKEDRIILTRDKKLIACKKSKPLIRIKSSDPYMQLKQLITLLGIKIAKEDLLSRCVKCNTKGLEPIDFKEAQESLKWENGENNSITDFLKCGACQQICWEGGAYDRSKKMFARLINSHELEEPMQEELCEEDEDEASPVADGDSPHSKIKENIVQAEKNVIEEGVLEEIEEMLKYE
jgi:uncharacterized protein with PIN domain/uncharacterized protein Usg